MQMTKKNILWISDSQEATVSSSRGNSGKCANTCSKATTRSTLVHFRRQHPGLEDTPYYKKKKITPKYF
eukprot:m.51357 g.51357  ORF g.51357 m.51357 type:complete len:69 (+) comp10729_c0_seq1:1587-1793(+)